MAEPVTIELRAEGVQEVKKALRSVADSFVEFDRKINRSTQASVKERVQLAKGEARAREAEAKQAAKQVGQIQLQELRGAQRVELEKVKSALKANRERERDAERSAKKQTDIADREAKKQTTIADREAKKQAQAWARQRDRIQTNSAIAAAKMITRDTAARQAARERFASTVGSQVVGSAGRALSTVGRVATGAVALGAGFTLADVAQRSIAAEQAAVALANSAYNPADPTTKRRDPQELLRKATGIEGATNFDRVDVLKGMQSYIALSSDASVLDAKNENALEIAKLAKATGTNVGDLFKTAGNLRVQNKTMDSSSQMNVLRAIVGQGKGGAVELDELAKVAGEITASSGQYAGDQSVNQRKLLGLSQIARRSADTAEAATAVRKLASDVSLHGDKMEAAGVKVKDKTGRGLMGPEDIIANLMEKTGGDTGKLHKLGIGERSMKIFDALKPVYNEAYDKAKGTDAQRRKAAGAAVRAEVVTSENAQYTKAHQEKELAEVMATKGERLGKAITDVKDQLDVILTPALERLATKLSDPKVQESITKLIAGLGQLAEWLINNPLKGLGAVVVGAVAKDLAGAGIGAAVKAAIASIIRGGGGGADLVPKVVPRGSGALATGAGAALGAAVGIYNTYETQSAEGEAMAGAKANVVPAAAELGMLTSKLRNSTASPDDIARGKALSAGLSSAVSEAKEAGGDSNVKGFALNMAATATGDAFGAQSAAARQSAATVTLMGGETERTVEAFVTALQQATTKLSAQNTNPRAANRNEAMSKSERGGAQ